jgi:hypothetical protein
MQLDEYGDTLLFTLVDAGSGVGVDDVVVVRHAAMTWIQSYCTTFGAE